MLIAIKLPKLICIVGSTASGKTSLSLKLAKKFTGEIISADSMQVYKYFDIGTAKVTQEEQNIIPHHMIDIREPNEEITVAQYRKESLIIIHNLISTKKLPFLVGGTGFYIQSIVDNLSLPPVPPDNPFRKDLEAKLANQKISVAQLYAELISKDPEAINIVESHNSRRIIRALEVIKTTGKKLSELRGKGPKLFNTLQIGLKISPEKLEKRINLRVDQMFDQGLIEETQNIVNKYGQVKPLEAIGYKEVIDYLNKKTNLQEAKDLIKLHTRQYAKRQAKWFKRDKNIIWIENYQEAEDLVEKFLAT